MPSSTPQSDAHLQGRMMALPAPKNISLGAGLMVQ
jgi:hypothetical protein